MIECLNEHTVRLTPDTPKKRIMQRPRKALNATERQIVDALKSAIASQMKGQMFLQRQLALADRYQAAVEARNRLKTVGLPGFIRGPLGCKVMRQFR